MLAAGESSACSTLIARYRRRARRPYVQQATVRSIALKALTSPATVCARGRIMTHLESLFILLVPALAAAAEQCNSLAGLKLPDTTITAAERIAVGEMPQTLSGLPPSQFPRQTAPSDFSRLPALCRITAVIKPAADSEIKIEIWMPEVGWNGKFVGVGNGGWAGQISRAGMV